MKDENLSELIERIRQENEFLSTYKTSRRLYNLRDILFHQIASLVMMNSGVISKLSNLGRRRSVL